VERGDELSDDACGSLFYPVGQQGDWMGLRISARSHYCSLGGSWAAERAGLVPWFVMLLSWSQSRNYRREGKIRVWDIDIISMWLRCKIERETKAD